MKNNEENLIYNVSKLNISEINYPKINNIFNNNFKTNNENDNLTFNFDLIHKLNFDEFYLSIERDKRNLVNNEELVYYTIFMFYSIKSIDQNPEKSLNNNYLLEKLNQLNFNHHILDSYYYKIFKLDFDLQYINLISNKAKFKDKMLFDIDYYKSALINGKYLNDFFINQIAFINHIEFIIIIINNSDNNLLRLEFNIYLVDLFISYFIWRNMIEDIYKSNFLYDEIIIHLFKYNLIQILEYYTLSKEIKLLKSILKKLFYILLQLEIDSRELIIIDLIVIMIFYTKFLNSKASEIKHYLDLPINNKNLNFIKKIIKDTTCNLSNSCTDIILLLKVTEYYFLQQYNKDLKNISESLNKMNVSDFINNNFFLYETVYDIVDVVYKSFKDKIYWNFCDIINHTYCNYPKLIKKTFFFHLNYLPQQESLLYNIIQYYYSNKNFRNCKIIIRKLLSIEPKTSLNNDIQSITLIIFVNILISQDRYAEALENAIINLERIKEIQARKDINNFNEELLNRAYFILGFCYCKISDQSPNYQDRIQSIKLALSSFKEANRSYDNPVFRFYLARQYYELRLFNDAHDSINNIDDLINSNNSFLYALRILIYLSILKFDKAQLLADTITKEKKNLMQYYHIYILLFYIKIIKLIDNPGDDGYLIDNMIEIINLIFEDIEKEYKRLLLIINSENFISLSKDNSENDFIKIIKYSNFDPYIINHYEDIHLKISKKKYLYEKKMLDELKITILKKLIFLDDLLINNEYDKSFKLYNLLITIFDNCSLNNTNEDENYLMIKAISADIEKKYNDSENIYKKILELSPSNMIALKRISKLFLTKKDYSNAFIYLNTAIKIDDNEADLWKMLSIYYLKKGDNSKYHECIMRELENSKNHVNSFLFDLIPKVII